MARTNEYYMLVTSLPYLRSPFVYDDRPINRIQLERRLAMLEPEDAAELAQFEDLIQWDRLTIDRTDEEIVAKAATVVPSIRSELVRAIALWRIEVRSVIAALRRRHRGESAPEKGLKWGYGRWVDHIRRHWSEPNFGLELVFPWLESVRTSLSEGDFFTVERILLGTVWEQTGRFGGGHEFDFEAVVVYLLRWTVAVRWRRYDEMLAAQRFDEMVELGLGQYASLYA